MSTGVHPSFSPAPSPTLPEASEGCSAREYRAGDEHEITEMLGAVFKWSWSLDRWHWYFRGSPHGPALIHVLEQDGRVVGHIAHVGSPAFVDGRRVHMATGGHLMVLPEFRGRFGMRRLVKEFLASDAGRRALAINFPTDTAAILLQRYSGLRHLGELPQWVWERPGGPRARPCNRLRRRRRATRRHLLQRSWPGAGLGVEPLGEPGAEVDALAESSAAYAPCIRLRDATYLRWRWRQPDNQFAVRAARDRHGALRGWVVFGAAELGGSPEGMIVDALADDYLALRALLLDAVANLAAHGCTRVTFSYLDPRPWARHALLRTGFQPSARGINVLAGPLPGQDPPVTQALDAWYLTLGDTERV